MAKSGGANSGQVESQTRLGCTARGCKHSDQRMGFCGEHYEQFKFGLIKRSGEPVPDYEKKFEHYQAFLARRRAHHVA